MSRYLIDTHIFLWTLFEPEKLSPEARAILQNMEKQVFVSAISFWEISLKFALGKLELEGCLPEDMPEHALATGLSLLPLKAEHVGGFYKLPRLKHKDPFDRMLIWQAIVMNLPLISADKAFAEYKSHGLNLIC